MQREAQEGNKYFTINAQNNSYLLVDSDDRAFGSQAENFYQSDTNNFIISVPTVMNNIYRISMNAVNYYYDIPNINPRNNSFYVVDDPPVNPRLVTIPEGYYTTNAALGTAIQNALNAQAAFFGVWTVSFNAVTGAIQLATTVVPFNIWAAPNNIGVANQSFIQCTGINYQRVDLSEVASLTKTNLYRPTRLYTRYMDITSNALTKWNRSDVSTSVGSANLVERIYFTAEFISSAQEHFFTVPFLKSKYMRYAPASDVSNIDIKILDEFGAPLYVPSYSQFSVGLILRVTNYPDQ